MVLFLGGPFEQYRVFCIPATLRLFAPFHSFLDLEHFISQLCVVINMRKVICEDAFLVSQLSPIPAFCAILYIFIILFGIL